MTSLLLLASMMSSSKLDAFSVQSDLQALYDEATQAELQFETPLDVDEYHAVRFAAGWTFVDASGTSHSWNDMRGSEISALGDHKDWLVDGIQKVVSMDGSTAVVLVTETVVKKDVAEMTSYKDTWIKDGNSWKQQSRAQIGAAKSGPYHPYAY